MLKDVPIITKGWFSIMSLLLVGYAFGLPAFSPGLVAFVPPIETIEDLWAGIDPRALPLEIEVIKSWDEGDVHLEMLYFTGEVFEGEKTRIFGYLGRPKTASKKLPGVLHIHGGGQTANLEWPRFWAKRGFICLSFDFCGNTNLPTLGPEYRREHFTKWGKVPGDMMKGSGGLAMTPTPRHNPWFHWALAARRGLTLLERQPQVNGDQLGIFGISVGGTLSWTVAGVDNRVKTAVPIYGCGFEFYDYPPKVDAPQSNDLRLWRKLIAPESCSSRIHCPILFLSATNDGHGKMDLAYRTLDLSPSPVRRQLFTANYDHHVEPIEARSLPIWMETHLLKTHPSWPASPLIEVFGPGVPKVRVTCANPDNVELVDIYYCLNNHWPMSRFWRLSSGVKRAGNTFVCEVPCMAKEDTLILFANVSERSGLRQSSRLVTQPLGTLPGILPTLKREALIDSMDSPVAWNWVPAYTDPSRDDHFFEPWTGPAKKQGFTLDRRTFPHANPMVFYFGTRKIGDPQFKGTGNETLLLDLYLPHTPSQLTVRVRHRKTGDPETEFTFQPPLPPNDPKKPNEWHTLRLKRQQFTNTKGEILPYWEHVEFFILNGKSPANIPPVFRQLRWDRQGKE